jgi:endonuclease/exonuclease/phosphatase family metal-dependent hydrolase
LWASNISTNSFAPSPLTGATRYYWQVVARNNNGSTTGPVWSFTTAGSPTPPPSSSTFRMMTWNIHHGYTTGNVYNLLAQVQLMVAQNPDVIALEEVQTWDENQPPKLKSLLEQMTGQTWTLVWAPVTSSAGTEGNVILTRLPVVTSTFQQLHATSDWTVLLANRSVAQATVLVNSVPVNVFATHLDYANTTYRTVQEQQLMAWLWNFSGPRLTGGDFNSWWGESWITTMETQHTDTWHDVTGLQDLGYTVNQAVRFDYVFRSIDNNWRVTPTDCFAPVTSLSDHNPVVADFTVQ